MYVASVDVNVTSGRQKSAQATAHEFIQIRENLRIWGELKVYLWECG